MMNAMEYGIMHKIPLASEFLSGTIDNVITGLRNIIAPVEGTGLSTIPTKMQDVFIYEDWKQLSPEWADD